MFLAQRVEVLRRDEAWRVFYLGDEGKKRLAADIVIPAGVAECDLAQYLADVRHEFATPRNPEVRRVLIERYCYESP